jgi:methionyl-tRNA synthetase
MVTYEEFRKIELKIGTVKDVQLHPQADRLYILTVDVGGVTRQLVAGIRASYEPQALQGRQVVVVDNLAPAVIRGVESQGMVLAATDESGICVVSPDRHVLEGSIVK